MVKTVSCTSIHQYTKQDSKGKFARKTVGSKTYKVAVYDCGCKLSILDSLLRIGCDITVVPWDTPAQSVLDMNPDGVFLSNGPGDPKVVSKTYEQARILLGKVPIFGICLGHQMLSAATGGTITKLKFGHRGANHPVVNMITGKVEITAQNHGFCLDFATLGPLVPKLSGGETNHPNSLEYWVSRHIAPVVETNKFGRVRLSHVNINDYTCAGIQFLDKQAFSVQYHPEASPGPSDSSYLITAFAQLMDGKEEFLKIDIAKDRLSSWDFSEDAFENEVNNA